MIAAHNSHPRRRKHSESLLPHFYLNINSHAHRFSLYQLVSAPLAHPHDSLSESAPTNTHYDPLPLLPTVGDGCSIFSQERELSCLVEQTWLEGVGRGEDGEQMGFTRCSE